jgi:hypothetical protein
MTTSKAVPPALERAVRHLRGVASCQVGGDLQYDDARSKWVLPVVLEISRATEFIARRTHWIVVVDPAYPFGQVDVYPSASDSITVTFPHQARNVRGPTDRAWRDGKLCVDSPLRGERFLAAVRDPVGDVEDRLAWYARRSLAWLEAAAVGGLTAPGDPFELPWKDPAIVGNGVPLRIVHDESRESYTAWAGRDTEYGEARLGVIPGIDGPQAIGTFLDGDGRAIRTWGGRAVTESGAEGTLAIWWLWSSPVVLPPWHAPGTWGELRSIGRACGVDVDTVLREVARRTRGQKGVAVLLVGYPIPIRIGDTPTEVHWDGLLLPTIPADGKAPRGFRANEVGSWWRDRQGVFRDEAELRYLPTENWSEGRLRARGGLPEAVRAAKVALIGLGALGSVLAELLVRAGARHLALFDGDSLYAGNICRHTATLDDVGRSKVDVAHRLMQISPHVEIMKYGDGIPASPQAAQDLLEHYDAIVDCTASSTVTAILAQAWWATPRLFLSASVGYAARRVFAFSAFSNQFPAAEFDAQIQSWLQQETSAWGEHGELLEGAGCWSPLFPARHDDMVLAAAVCLKELEKYIVNLPQAPVVEVFEQARSGLAFESLARAVQMPEKGLEA